MRTYKELKSVLNNVSESQVYIIQKFLSEMSDDEFNEIPTLLFTPDAKKVIETYGTIISTLRTKVSGATIQYEIYVVYPTIFKIII